MSDDHHISGDLGVVQRKVLGNAKVSERESEHVRSVDGLSTR